MKFIFEVKKPEVLNKKTIDDLRRYFFSEEVKINTYCQEIRVHLSEE